jgi:solute carrier family 27 fatty acid transporter 1/4
MFVRCPGRPGPTQLSRIIHQLQMTGTYKLQKTDLQKEGFDVTQIADPIYFMGPKDTSYRLLDPEGYSRLVANLAQAKL